MLLKSVTELVSHVLIFVSDVQLLKKLLRIVQLGRKFAGQLNSIKLSAPEKQSAASVMVGNVE